MIWTNTQWMHPVPVYCILVLTKWDVHRWVFSWINPLRPRHHRANDTCEATQGEIQQGETPCTQPYTRYASFVPMLAISTVMRFGVKVKLMLHRLKTWNVITCSADPFRHRRMASADWCTDRLWTTTLTLWSRYLAMHVMQARFAIVRYPSVRPSVSPSVIDLWL